MSRFLRDANEILEAAAAVPEASSALTILIHPQGQIHIVDGAALSIESLQAANGCDKAFRVTRERGAIRVEGRDGSNRCILERTKPARQQISAAAALGVFRDQPRYSIAGTLALA